MERDSSPCKYILGWHDRDLGGPPGPYSRECGLPADHPVHDVSQSVSVYADEMRASGSNYDARGNAWDVNDHLDRHRHHFEAVSAAPGATLGADAAFRERGAATAATMDG